jgi:hypothetical protein
MVVVEIQKPEVTALLTKNSLIWMNWMLLHLLALLCLNNQGNEWKQVHEYNLFILLCFYLQICLSFSVFILYFIFYNNNNHNNIISLFDCIYFISSLIILVINFNNAISISSSSAMVQYVSVLKRKQCKENWEEKYVHL